MSFFPALYIRPERITRYYTQFIQECKRKKQDNTATTLLCGYDMWSGVFFDDYNSDIAIDLCFHGLFCVSPEVAEFVVSDGDGQV